MRIAFCADVHIANHQAYGGALVAGINRRCQLALDTLERAVDVANRQRCTHFVVLGDLYDSTRPLPQVETAVRVILRKFAGDVLLLLGNHDRNSAIPGDHALGPLAGGNVLVIDQPTVIGGCLGLLPFRAESVTEWFEAEAAKLVAQGARVFGVHFGLHDDSMRAANTWMRDAPSDAVDASWLMLALQQLKALALFAGNWHQARVFGLGALDQVGALVPTGWDNPGLDELGGLCAYDVATGKLTMTFLPGPRFVKARSVTELRDLVEQGHRRGHQVYAEAVLARGDVPEAMTFVKEAKAAGKLVDGVVLVDAADTKAEARTAAHGARKADTLDEALATYVGVMPVDEGVSRDAVLERAKAYLKAGRSAAL